MADYRLSEEADRDIDAIAVYTLENWNEAQADRYVMGLHTLLSASQATQTSASSATTFVPGTAGAATAVT